ncbi:hypothetical protein ACFE04_021411 [Oxalis oulophora]
MEIYTTSLVNAALTQVSVLLICHRNLSPPRFPFKCLNSPRRCGLDLVARRSGWAAFTELINKTGVTWDVDANKVYAPEEIWQKFTEKNKGFKTFSRNGCKNYELLAYIFSPSTATEKNQEKSAKVDEALDMLSSTLSSREQLTKAKLEKMERKKNKKDMMEGKISAFEEQRCTIDEAMNLLNDMPHLSAMQYTIDVE